MHLEIMSALLNLVINKHGLNLIVDAGVLYGVALSMATQLFAMQSLTQAHLRQKIYHFNSGHSRACVDATRHI